VTLKEFADAAAEDQRQADALAQAYQAAGAATGDYAARIDEAIAAGAGLAFSDTQVRDSLQPLIAVTGDAARANELLATAEDIARLKKVDLATAAEAVAKAEGGQATALAKLVGVNATGLTSTEVLAEAQARAAGQAKIYGSSSAAAGEKAGIAMAELGEKIGSMLLPVLDALVPAIGPIIDAFGTIIDALLPILIPLVKNLGGALAIVARVIATVAGALAGLIGWISDAIDAVVDFLSHLDPLKAVGDFFGGLFAGDGIAGLAGSSGGGYGGPVPGPVEVNVLATSADPEAVVRAIVRWARLNGGFPALQAAVERG
jgi:phage-related minor tail protein